MASYSWTDAASGDWSDNAKWTPNTIPNDAAADVTIDAKATTAAYTVTIAADESITVKSLTLNGVNNAEGVNSDPYLGAVLEIDGTLAFAPGSDGHLGDQLQTHLVISDGTLINAGTVDAFIQAEGNVLITGTNGFYVTNWLQALGGTVTVDTPIAELEGSTLIDGIFEAKGDGAAVRLGGTHATVNITRIEGPSAIPEGWTEIIYSTSTASILEWDGNNYVPLETTLKEIGSRGTIDVLDKRDYTTTQNLTIDAGGMLNLQAGTVTTAGLTNAGIIEGFANIAGDTANNGTLTALGGSLVIGGTLSGTGLVNFDMENKPGGTLSTSGSTLELHAVTSGQTIAMNGYDTLVLDTASAFAGTISAKVGDKLVLTGLNPTTATVSGSNLIIGGASGTLATLHLSGDYSAEHFAVDGSTLTLTDGAPTPTPTPTPVSANQLVFQDNDGSVATWQMDGTTVSSFTYRPSPGDGWYLRGTGSFYTGDAADYVWHNENGQVAIWQMQGTTVVSGSVLDNLVTTDWHMKATADFYHTGHSAILWQNDNGSVALWNMNGSTATSYDVLSSPGSDWHVRGAANFYGDGNTDILWQNDSGQIAIWDMDGGSVAKWGVVDNNPGAAWQIKGTGDFYGNGHSDILLQNTNGQIAIWDMNGTTISQMGTVDSNPGSSWHVAGTADVNGDGKADITFKNDDGSVAVWEMNGSTVTAGGWVSNPGSSWNLLGSGDMRFVASTGAGEMLTASPVVAEEFNMATAAAGDHTIMGFNTTQDMLALSAAQFGSFDAVQAATSNTGAGAMIDLGNSTSLLLPGVNPASLHASNFALV